jgi:glycosyltransferase involved in cell wall biosynthesis
MVQKVLPTQLKEKHIIAIFTPSLEMGGTERVVAILANQFAQKSGVQVHLVLSSNKKPFFSLDERVYVHTPGFDYKHYIRLRFSLMIMKYLRRTCINAQVDTLLSFGGRYNAFSILAMKGTGINVYVSDRSQPGISYGVILDILNPRIYRSAKGIIAQTSVASSVVFNKTKHKNIKVIGNPVDLVPSLPIEKKKVVLNVGRFITGKNQNQLIRLFEELPNKNWELWFIGDGPEWENCKKLADKMICRERIKFFGKLNELHNWYMQASIFAFTSVSEGFPNALAEAMSAGCASVSYDCLAGPSDLIEDQKNGFLVDLNDIEKFKKCLLFLMDHPHERERIGKLASKSVLRYEKHNIANQMLNFILYGN